MPDEQMTGPSAPAAAFRLGPFTVDTLGKRLLLGTTRLEADAPQVDVLACLAGAFPAIVRKDELIEQVWGGRFVTDAALHKSISTLRRILREHGDGTEWIETRHRRGYQLARAPAWDNPSPVAQDPGARELPSGPATETDEPATERREPDMQELPSGTGGQVSTSATRVRPLAFWIPAAAILALTTWLAVTMLEIRMGAPSTLPDRPEGSRKGQPVDEATQARLKQMDRDQLVATIKQGFAGDDALVQAAIALLRAPGPSSEDRDRIPLADKFSGIRAYRLGEFDSAMAWYRNALAGFEDSGNALEQANVLNNMGVLFSETGQDPERAARWFEKSLAIRQTAGDHGAALASHKNLANLWLGASSLEEATKAVQAYVAAAERIGAPQDRVDALLLQGDVALARAEPSAGALFERARTEAIQGGLALSAASAEQRLGRMALEAGDGHAARRAFRAALGLYAQSGEQHQLAVVHYNLASAEEFMGESATALLHYSEVVQGAPETGSSLRVDALLGKARMLRRLNRIEEGRAALNLAQREAATLGNPLALAPVWLARSTEALLAGEKTAARAHLEQARASLGDSAHRQLRTELAIQDAWVSMAHGDFSSALQRLSRHAAAEPAHAHRLASVLAMAQVGAGDIPAAFGANHGLRGPTANSNEPGSTVATDGESKPLALAVAFVCGILAGVLAMNLFRRRSR